MQPKTMKQQNTLHGSNQPASSVRRQPGQRSQTRASMATEYQERFLPPTCHKAIITTSTKINPYHPLKGTGVDMTNYVRSYFVAQKWIKNPQKIQVPQPPVPPKNRKRYNSAPHEPGCCVANQNESIGEDYMSVYKNDFQVWSSDKRQPYKARDNLKVNQGLIVPKDAFKKDCCPKKCVAALAPQVQEPLPIESMTSYRSDYITHPVQPRMKTYKPAYQTNKSLPLQPATSFRKKQAVETNPDPFDEASELFQQFKKWSLGVGTNFYTQGKAKELTPPANQNGFLSTTHADYLAHKCQCAKPILPVTQTCEKSKEPFQGTTTQKEDYKVWDMPQCFPTQRNCAKKTTVAAPKSAPPAEIRHTNPKLEQTRACSLNCNATEKPQCPAENGAVAGYECISRGDEESRVYWASGVDKGVTWSDESMCEEQAPHQVISCMMSSRT